MEEWRAIPGYPGYEASSEGRVRCMRLSDKRKSAPWILSFSTSGRYARMSVINSRGEKVSASCHRLVAMAFHGEPLPGMVTRHLDGDRYNNKPTNLSWGTCSENEQDKRRHGTYQIGAGNPRAKLTDGDVREIRRRREAGAQYAKLAAEYGVTTTMVRFICKRLNWRHVA